MTTASITIRRKSRPGETVFSIPMLVLWLVVAPLAVVLFPMIAIFCVLAGINPFDLYGALWRITRALTGSEVAMDDGARSIMVRIEESVL